MLPTEAAVRLHEPLDQAFGIINRAIQERVAFDPKVTQRVFRVAMSDVSEVYYLPRLMARLVHVAPSVRLDVVPLAVDTVAAAMRAGEVDLAIGTGQPGLIKVDEDDVSTSQFSDRLRYEADSSSRGDQSQPSPLG